LEINLENIEDLVKAGRARWKIENETFNTLKNQGYQFEHNFGHGYKNLCHVFGNLMLLAFLIDQIQQHGCPFFQAALKKIKYRKYLWERIRILFYSFCINSWKDIFLAIAKDYIRPNLALYNTS